MKNKENIILLYKVLRYSFIALVCLFILTFGVLPVIDTLKRGGYLTIGVLVGVGLMYYWYRQGLFTESNGDRVKEIRKKFINNLALVISGLVVVLVFGAFYLIFGSVFNSALLFLDRLGASDGIITTGMLLALLAWWKWGYK